MRVRLTGLKYFTVVSRVFGKVFSNNRAKSGSFKRLFMSEMTFCENVKGEVLWAEQGVPVPPPQGL